jgi:hypothetical protein
MGEHTATAVQGTQALHEHTSAKTPGRHWEAHASARANPSGEAAGTRRGARLCHGGTHRSRRGTGAEMRHVLSACLCFALLPCLSDGLASPPHARVCPGACARGGLPRTQQAPALSAALSACARARGQPATPRRVPALPLLQLYGPGDKLVLTARVRVRAGPLDAGNSGMCQSPGIAQFAADALEVRSDAGAAIIKVQRLQGFFGAAAVEYVTVNGSAAPFSQYVPTSGTVSWRSLEGQPKSISVPLVNTGSYTRGKFRSSFAVRLTLSSGLELGDLTETIVTILNTNAATGKLGLPAADFVVSESAGAVNINVTRSGGSDCEATVSYRTAAYPVGGAGHYGEGKPLQQGKLIWGEGDSSTKIISLPIIDDEIPKPFPGDRFYLELYHDSSQWCAPIGKARVLVTVTDNDQVGLLSIKPTMQVFSNEGFVMIPIARVGGSATPVLLDYFTSPGESAVQGQHYERVAGRLIWLHDDFQTKSVRVNIPQGTWWNGLQHSKKFLFQVSYVLGTSMLSNILATTVEIVDSLSSPGRIGFEPKFTCREGTNAPSGICHYFTEGESFAKLVVTRTGGQIGQVSVRYSSTNWTASSYDDAALASGVLTWEEGDTSPKSITIQILNDTTAVPFVEYVKVELFDQGGLSVVNPSFAVAYLALIDRDGAGSVHVRSVQDVVWESEGPANFTVHRVGGNLGTLSCVVKTVSRVALAGVDFIPVSERMTWFDGDSTPKTLVVQLIDDIHYRLGMLLKTLEVQIMECSNNTVIDPRFEKFEFAITDDDALPGYASFAEIDYNPFTQRLSGSLTTNTLVGVGAVTLTVVRKGGLQGNLTVRYRTLNGTAEPGRDYSAASGQLRWLEGDVSAKHINIPILNPALPEAPTFVSERAFSVVLENQATYSGSFEQPLLDPVPAMSANVVIQETRGKGYFKFEKPTYNVSENDGTVDLYVVRVGGRQGPATVNFATVRDSTATTEVADKSAVGEAFPSSCAGLLSSGVRSVRTVVGEIRQIYCDMSTDPKYGSASIFHWDTEEAVLFDRECLAGSGTGDMDNAILWADLTARIGHSATGSTNRTDYASWQAGATLKTSAGLDFSGQNKSSTGDKARPVPFPINRRVVWFDWQNRRIRWKNSQNVEVGNVGFDSAGISGNGGMDNMTNDFYFITDGVNMVHVGWYNISYTLDGISSTLNATLLIFDWASDTFQSHQATPMNLSDWCTPDYDAFGHVLWTVKGRVMYRNCNGPGVQVVLGGTIQNPMAQNETYNFSKCHESIPGCDSWEINANMKSGVDLFVHVDSSGFLYFGDRGGNGGLFGCTSSKPFGVVRTNIEVSRRVNNDFVPHSGTLTWGDGDVAKKNITISVVKDRTRDDQTFEKFTVQISGSDRIIVLHRKAEVSIYDVDTAGTISIAPDHTIMSERGKCCGNCGAHERDRLWCSNFYISRSHGSRGPACVDYSLQAVSNSTLPLEFSADNTSILSAYAGIHVQEQNGTVCWRHNDTSNQTLTVYFPLHQTFDLLHKRYAIDLSSPSNTMLQSSLACCWSGKSSPVVRGRATQIIEDKDAVPGFLTLDTDPISSFATFMYTTKDGSAQISVERFFGSHLDMTVDFSTEAFSNTTQEVPFSTRIVDGTHGADSFCLANNSRFTGACVDSSSSLKCTEGKYCYLRENNPVKRATQTNQYASPPNDALFIGTSGTIRWKHGEGGKKSITIPILSPNNSDASSSPYPLPAFRIVLKNVKASQSGLETRVHFPPALPPRNAFGNCSSAACFAYAPGSVIGLCDAHRCRKSETSEAIVVLQSQRAAGFFRLLNSSYFIPENLQPSYVILTVKRILGNRGIVTVNYTCTSFAVAGVAVAAKEAEEFVPVKGMLRWEDGDVSDKYINVPIIDDSKYIKTRIKRSFRVDLHGATGNAEIEPAWQTATLIVVDDDAKPGSVVFRNSWQSFPESHGRGKIQVARVGGDDLDIYVEFNTGDTSSWAAVLEQTANASAHSSLLSAEIYFCATTLDRTVSASAVTTRRGGGVADYAFDFDNRTFWDGDHESDDGPKILTVHFSKCRLEGAVVQSYAFVTEQTSAHSGCPSDWTFEGSADGMQWNVLDTRDNRPCSPVGSEITYHVNASSVKPFLYYRWIFTLDNNGLAAIKIYETLVFFAGGVSTLQPHLCNNMGKCCIFKMGECDPSGGFTNRLLLQSSHDFNYSRQILQWKEGDNSTKTVEVPILNDCMGCSHSRCNSFDPLQDLPYEEFAVHLGLVSDAEIHQFAGSPSSIFPFRANAVVPRANATATVSIVDDDGPGILSLWSTSCGLKSGMEVLPFTTVFGEEDGYDASCAILETARTIEFMVARTGSARGPASVQYTVEGDTAIPFLDFIPKNGTLEWTHNDSTPKVFEVEIIRTPGHQSGRYTRTIRASLLGANLRHGGGHQVVQGGAQLRICERSVLGTCVDPTKAHFVATIVDTDANPGAIHIVRADQPPELQYYVDQANGTVSILLERVNGSDLAIFANYETVKISNDQARPCNSVGSSNCEYVNSSGKVHWNDRESGLKIVSVQLSASRMRRPFETFKFRIWGILKESISDCGGYGSVDDSRTFQPSLCEKYFESIVTVTIRRSASTGYLGLNSQAPWPFVTSDRLGYAVVVVDRLMGRTGIVSVDYKVEGYPDGGTAIAGIHFLANSGQLTWPERDDTPKFIQIDIPQGSVPMNTAVDLTVRLRFHSPNTDIAFAQRTARVLIKSSNFQYGWNKNRISESNTVFGELNKITLELQPNAPIGASTSITVSGITGTQTPDNSEISIEGPSSHLFGRKGNWTQLSGSLILTVSPGQSIPFVTTSTISFVVKNAHTNQTVNPAIIVAGNVRCERENADGVPLNCPESIYSPSTNMEGTILQTSTKSFTALQARSRLCLYDTCPHSTFLGALNYITVSFSSPVLLAAGARISLSGLLSSESVSGNTSVTFANMSSNVGVGETKSYSLGCKCFFPRCSCEQTFAEIPKGAPVYLRIQLQCNALGFGREKGDTISVQVGTNGKFTDLDSSVSPPGPSCENNCANFHDLFNPVLLDVREHVSETGRLFVSISSSSNFDFCGQKEFLNANITVQWQIVSPTLREMPATWDQKAGSLLFYIPSDHEIGKNQDVAFTFALRNSKFKSQGSNLYLFAESSDASTVVGPAAAKGMVMTAETSPAIEWASIPESNVVKGKSNRIGLGFKFNGPIGGSPDGIRLNVSGLITQGQDDPEIMIRSCSFCDFQYQQHEDLSRLAGDPRLGAQGKGEWNPSKGQLQLWIRGPGPSYLIPDLSLSGMISLVNPESPSPSNAGISLTASVPVHGAELPASRVLKSLEGGAAQVLRGSVIASVLSGGAIEYSKASGYVVQDTITLRIDLRFNLDYLDEISVYIPSLTTCESFVNSKSQACVQTLVGSAQLKNVSLVAGMLEQSIIFRWNESSSTLTLSPHGGRAVCPNRTMEITIKPSDYGCTDYFCKFKLLPDSSLKQKASIRSDAVNITCWEKDCGSLCRHGDECSAGLTCKNRNDFHELGPGEVCAGEDHCICSDLAGEFNPPSCAKFDALKEPLCSSEIPLLSSKIEVLSGLAWARESENVSSTGRAWFGVSSHLGSLFIYGGITSDGFASNVLVSNDARNWKEAGTAEFGARAFFPSVSHDGFLWVLGGHNGTFASAMNDVWKSENGVTWCRVNERATWDARFSHAAVSHGGMLWIIGGSKKDASNLNDVWKSYDGVQWTSVLASGHLAFSPRSGHSVVVYKGQMWLYGGNSADVWKSADGSQWVRVTPGASWGIRRHHSAFYFDQRMWLVAGHNTVMAFSDIWSSRDGKNWDLENQNAPWGKRYGSATTIFEGRMRMIGGSVYPCNSNGTSVCNGTVARDLKCTEPVESCAGNEVWVDSSKPITIDYVKIISSTSVLGADNRIEVSVQFDSRVEAGAVLQISGLDNVIADNILPVIGKNATAVVGRQGRYDFVSSSAQFITAQEVPAGSLLSFSFSVRNNLTPKNVSVLHIEVSHDVGKFSASRSSSWSSLQVGAIGRQRAINTSDGINPAPYYGMTGGVMFDVDVKNSIMLHGFRLHLPRTGFRSLINDTAVTVFYLEGSHTKALTDASKWCKLGVANIKVNVTQNTSTQRIGNATVSTTSPRWANERDFVRVSDLQHAQFGWLGSQPSWAQNSILYRSSAYSHTTANITAVLSPGSDGLWHSGDAFPNEYFNVSCIHFPLCPLSWPHNRNQWLSFDLGAKYILAGFRTSFPPYARRPTYYVNGGEFQHMDSSLWEKAHFKEFELQYSSGGLEGPWITALAGKAAKQGEGSQAFMFEPRIARFWRLLMKNNHGFPYLAMESIEFFGAFATCQSDSLYIELDQNGKAVEGGIGISGGTHSFRLETGVGVEANSSALLRRGDVFTADNVLAVKVGTQYGAVPIFAWSGTSSPKYIAAEPREFDFLMAEKGFSIVVRFVSGRGEDGHIFGMGDTSAGGLSLRLVLGNLKFHQGTYAQPKGLDLKNLTSYCYVVTYTNGSLTTYAEENPGAVNTQVKYDAPLYYKRESALLTTNEIPPLRNISIGASPDTKKFAGQVSRLAVYEGTLDRAQMMRACSNQSCDAQLPDGRCYTPAPLNLSSPVQIPFGNPVPKTHGATDIDFLRLPVRSCFNKYRIRVPLSAGTKWCIQELSMFHDAAPYWGTVRVGTDDVGVSVHQGTCSASQVGAVCNDTGTRLSKALAFDGYDNDGGSAYCNSLRGSGISSTYLSVTFQDRKECINGYRIQATLDGSEPTAWYFEGQVTGGEWITLDSQFGTTWQNREWKSFQVDVRSFLLVTNPYDVTYLMRWVSDEVGWEIKADASDEYQQTLSSAGGMDANVFQANGLYYLEFLRPNKTRSALLRWDPELSRFQPEQLRYDSKSCTQVGSKVSLSLTEPNNSCPTSVVCPPDHFVPPDDIPALYDQGTSSNTCPFDGSTVQPSLPTDVMMSSYSWEIFTQNDLSYIVISRYAGIQSCSFLFQIVSNGTHNLTQTFQTYGAVSWVHFKSSGISFLVSANFYGHDFQPQNAKTTLYKWDGSMFQQWQSISVPRARALKHFENDGYHYLFASSAAESASDWFSSQAAIYRFNGAVFEYFTGLPAQGGAVGAELFSVNGFTYLALSNPEKQARMNSASKTRTNVYRWNNAAQWLGGLQFSDMYTTRAMFIERNIHDSNDVATDKNVITIGLRPDRPLPVGTTLVILGLVGSQTFQPTVAVTGRHASLFGYSAAFDAWEGRLTLVSQIEFPDRKIEIAFELQNGNMLQPAVNPVIMAMGTVRIPRASMNGAVLGISKFQAPGLRKLIATESSLVQGSLFNNITLVMSSTIEIRKAMVINVTNLRALATDGILKITGRDVGSIASSSFLYGASGNWSQNDESLRFELIHDVPAYADFSFSFTLRNKLTAQAPVFPVVRVQFQNGTDYIPAAESSTAILSCSHPSAFVLAELTDSNKVLGASNNITVRLQPNLGLVGGTRITIIGLEGSSTGDGNIKLWSRDRLFVEDRGSFAAVDRGLMVMTTLPKCKALCPGGSCLEHGNDCRFPFSYLGIVHYDCLQVDGLAFPVCSTVKTFDAPPDPPYVNTTIIINATTGEKATNQVFVPHRVMGSANSSGWGYCPSICGPTIPATEITEFKFQMTNAPQPRAPTKQDISIVDDKNTIQIVQRMTTKNGVLNAREGAKALALPAGLAVKTHGKLDYSLAELTVELWVKVAFGPRKLHGLVQIGQLALNLSQSGETILSLPPLSTGSSGKVYTFPTKVVNGSWHHISASWSDSTGNVSVHYNGVFLRAFATGPGRIQLNAALIIGSSLSASEVQITQVRLWSSASVQTYFNYMIDPSSVERVRDAPLLAYYPFSGASTFTGLSDPAFTTAGSDRSVNEYDLNLGGAEIRTIPLDELFLDVLHL